MTKILDRLHKIAVTSLMGITAGTAIILGVQLYEYFVYVRPNRALNKVNTSEKTGENLENTS